MCLSWKTPSHCLASAVLLLTVVACGGGEPGAPASAPAVPEPAPVAAEEARAASMPGRGSTASRVDGLEIAWEAVGAGPATLVFIHGWQCDRSFWREQVAHFADDYRLVLVDLPGHGESAGGREDWSMAAFGEDVAAVVGEVVSGPVVLIGHSMGGPVILEAASGIEGLVGLVAVDTLREVLAPPPDEAELTAAMAPVEADYAGVVQNFIASMFVASTPPALRAEILATMTAGDREAGIGMMRGYARMDYAPAFARLAVPLVIFNSDYRPTPAEAIRERYPTLLFETIEGVGHFPMLEAPQRFNTRLEEILDSLFGGLTAAAAGRQTAVETAAQER